jgi:hypothetical protein
MKVLYTHDAGDPVVMELETLIQNFTASKTWARGGPHQGSLREELESRGWYESDRIDGRFLVLNLAKFGGALK